ncbi:hypothetical protein A2Y99_05390 [Candidatus Gottesmanbacteria bacterium RBG_13_37_7]|uniref:Glycosyltransferase RgtA/B/C/D-like domain-containing protein n=1 Tax=Candidatus Gottesmanbacteria bacterium RBG_13_37_7 TaxID=1798369 RepID=A0A1F5YHD0_9BACT|nr:MAG: hypothetical protein A2Y99_05390 [Candidatus Gottesmanbacteria bacterium RBG_13_37_7]
MELCKMNIKKLLPFLLIAVFISNFALFVSKNESYFTRKFDPDFYGKLYSDSQYVKGELSKGGIGDDGLYAFAGHYYLFNKGDVSAVNFEHPPLGKYLIGISVLLFNNENIINLIYFFLLLLLTYKIGLLITKDRLFSLIGTVLLSFDPLFLDNLLRSMLDLPFTLFFIAAVYYFLIGLGNKNTLYLSSLFWGMAFSTRFFPVLGLILILLGILISIYNKKLLYSYILSLFIIPTVYLVSHLSFFFYHPSLVEFIRHKIWMLSWFRGSSVIFANIWQNISKGIFINSQGVISSNKYWTPVLPITVLLAMTGVRKALFNKNNSKLIVLFGICFLYLFYLTILTNGDQKFLMPIYPLIIILAIHHAVRGCSIITACGKRIFSRLKIK